MKFYTILAASILLIIITQIVLYLRIDQACSEKGKIFLRGTCMNSDVIK